MLARIRQLHYLTILAAQIILHVIISFTQDHPLLIVLFVIGLFGIFGTVISVIWDRALPRALASTCCFLAIASGVPPLIPGLSPWDIRAGLCIGSFSYAAFIFIAIISIGKTVFVSDRVTANRIIGSVCVYLLIGTCFGFLYAALALILPGSIDLHSMAAAATTAGPSISSLNDFMYFSLSALTTTGFGDITPVHPLVKTFASFESVIGSLYVAVMIARLVGMHITQGSAHHHSHADGTR